MVSGVQVDYLWECNSNSYIQTYKDTNRERDKQDQQETQGRENQQKHKE